MKGNRWDKLTSAELINHLRRSNHCPRNCHPRHHCAWPSSWLILIYHTNKSCLCYLVFIFLGSSVIDYTQNPPLWWLCHFNIRSSTYICAMWCIMIITEPKGDIKIVMAEQFRNLAMLSWYFTFSPLLLLSPQTSQIGPCGGGKKMVLVKHCNALFKERIMYLYLFTTLVFPSAGSGQPSSAASL